MLKDGFSSTEHRLVSNTNNNALFILFFPIMVKTSKNGFVIESEVEIPAARMGSNVYPFDELEVGESFFVP